MLIIDGHNLIGAIPKIKLSDPRAKDKLLDLLIKYQNVIDKKIIIVFDGKGYGGYEINREGKIEIRYPSGKNSADDVIIKLMMNKSSAREMTIITSDNVLLNIAKRKHIASQKSKDFALEIIDTLSKSNNEQIDDYLSPVEVEDWIKYFHKK